MDSLYLRNITIAFCCCAALPLSYHFWLSPEQNKREDIETQYEHKYVDGPIQPLPHLVAIDHDWRLLGQALFHSSLLSKDNTVACSSCHLISAGGDDGFALSTGVDNKKGTRNSPTVINAVFNFRQFWDGRELNLELQVENPIHNPVEMATNWQQVITKLEQEPYFSRSFTELSKDGVTEKNIIKALVTFEESLVTPDSPIDLYLLGDKQALTSQQKRGLDKFINYGCATCHQGKNIGGNFYQKLGRIDNIPQKLTLDLGKYEFSKEEADKYVFKVPSLRNIADTAPYFHNGSVETLEEAIEIMASTQLGMKLSAQDIQDLVALLHSFSAPVQEPPEND